MMLAVWTMWNTPRRGQVRGVVRRHVEPIHGGEQPRPVPRERLGVAPVEV